MGAQEPLVMDLGDLSAGPGTAGGKGSSLARLTRAGFRVPPGFYVTTSAYLDFIGRDGLREQLLSAVSEGSPPARIGDLFAHRSLPAETADAITRAYAALGAEIPVAVRSSATVEDQPGMSATGQHDTYLNVRGEAAVLDAVKRCWASLWSERAPRRSRSGTVSAPARRRPGLARQPTGRSSQGNAHRRRCGHRT